MLHFKSKERILIFIVVSLFLFVSCKADTENRITAVSEGSPDWVTLTLINNITNCKYIEGVGINDSYHGNRIEMNPERLFLSDSIITEVHPGTYIIYATGSNEKYYIIDKLKVTADSVVCVFADSNMVRSAHFYTGIGSDSITFVNEIDFNGIEYSIMSVLFSPSTSDRWESIYFPSPVLEHDAVFYEDTLTICLENGTYDFIFTDIDGEQAGLWDVRVPFNDGYKSITSDDYAWDYDENVFIVNSTQDTLATCYSLTFAENLFGELPLLPGDTTYVSAAYGDYSMFFGSNAVEEYIIHDIKVSPTSEREELHLSVSDEHCIDSCEQEMMQSRYIGESEVMLEVFNNRSGAITELLITDASSSHPGVISRKTALLMPYSTIPIWLQAGTYEIFAQSGDGSFAEFSGIELSEDTVSVEITPSDMRGRPARFACGSGDVRIDVINHLHCSLLRNIYCVPTGTEDWGIDLSSSSFISYSDTLSIWCTPGSYDIMAVDVDKDVYVLWNTLLVKDSIYEWLVTYDKCLGHIAYSDSLSGVIEIANRLSEDIWYGYIRTHGSLDWNINENILGESILFGNSTFSYPVEPGCYDLRLEDYYGDYYQRDSIVIPLGNTVICDFTLNSRLNLEPVEVEEGVFESGEGEAQIIIVNNFRDDNIWSVFVTPSAARERGDAYLYNSIQTATDNILNYGDRLKVSINPGEYIVQGTTDYSSFYISHVCVSSDAVETLLVDDSDLVEIQGLDYNESTFTMFKYPGVLPQIRFVNSIDSKVSYLYLRSRGEESWGGDLLLNSYYLLCGSELIFPVSPGEYELRAEIWANGELYAVYEKLDVVISDSTDFTWRITRADLCIE